MNDIPLGWLLGLLLFLIVLSAFIAASETGLMALNRYRLLYLVKQKHRGASKAQTLLKHPDRLFTFFILSRKFFTLFISSLATIVALKLWGEIGVAITLVALTVSAVVFVEILPKTLAALKPEKIAFPAAHLYLPLLKLLCPVLWLVNLFANFPLKLLRVNSTLEVNTLGRDELRTLMVDANSNTPSRYHQMMLSIMDLESATVEDIMTPRSDIAGIDLEDPLEVIIKQIQHSAHTRLPVYKKTIDRVIGFLDLRTLLTVINQINFDKQAIIDSLLKPLFIPETTPLHKQMHAFKTDKERIGLVVDEYGDVKGLVTLDDLLQEIIGELMFEDACVKQHNDGSVTVDGGVTVREFNRITHSNLPTEGPKTINGLIVEYMETIPQAGTSVNLYGYHLEIIDRDENTIKQVRFHPKLA